MATKPLQDNKPFIGSLLAEVSHRKVIGCRKVTAGGGLFVLLRKVFVTFLIATAVIFFGATIFIFTIGNSILTIFFIIPLTKKLENKSLLRSNNRVVSSYSIALFIWFTILIVSTAVFYIFFQDSYLSSLVVGYIFATLFLLKNRKKYSANKVNFFNYFEKNKDYFWEELVDRYYEDRSNFFNYINSLLKKK